jgi:ribosomal protein S18 acetylase RimI-like enzyme
VAEWTVRPIAAADTRLLRHKILRPHQAPEELVYAGDDDAESLHLGTFLDGDLVGVATVVPMAAPDRLGMPDRPGERPGERAWQLRGMAVMPEFRGRGFGAAMVKGCMAHVARRGGGLMWFNARLVAVEFYRKLGFEAKGDRFEIPISGQHYVMWRAIAPQRAGLDTP